MSAEPLGSIAHGPSVLTTERSRRVNRLPAAALSQGNTKPQNTGIFRVECKQPKTTVLTSQENSLRVCVCACVCVKILSAFWLDCWGWIAARCCVHSSACVYEGRGHITEPGKRAQLIPLFSFSILLNLVGWCWFIKLYRFQVYTSTIHHCVLTTQSQVSFLHHIFDPMYPFVPPRTPLSLITTVMFSVYMTVAPLVT